MESKSPQGLSSHRLPEEILRDLWENVMPWVLHPAQKQSLDVYLDELYVSLGRPDLSAFWMKLSND